jgi:hypothetical protein
VAKNGTHLSRDSESVLEGKGSKNIVLFFHKNFDADDAVFWPSNGIRRLANVAHTILKKMKEQLLKCLEGYFMVDVFVCLKTHYVFLRPWPNRSETQLFDSARRHAPGGSKPSTY